MGIKRLLKPLAHLYMAGVNIRHWLFDNSMLRSEEFDIPIICIGNITVGGTGKTPMSELLLSHLSANHKVAILSRGYGRRSRGYVEVESHDHYSKVGDEPLQMKRKFQEAIVVVCEKRVEGVQRILREHPEVEVILMDDGFQHRYVKPLANIIMVDSTRPIEDDFPLPFGSLRDTPEALQRADIFVVTKCHEDMSESEMEQFRENLISREGQSVYFTRIINLYPTPIFPELAPDFSSDMDVIAIAGIGNPAPFINTLTSRYDLKEVLTFADHHDYTPGDITRIERLLDKHPQSVIITTEKDGVKFMMNNTLPASIKSKIYVSPIRMKFISQPEEELLQKIDNYVRKD